VLVFHCIPWGTWQSHRFLRNVAGSGYVAVSLFFVLSGFILTYVHASPGRASLDRPDFYVNRFARIYPTYLLGLALIAPFYVVHTIRVEGFARLAEGAFAVLVLLQAHVPSLAMAWNPPAWSLSDEAFFYALFPAMVGRLVRSRRSVAAGVGLACFAASLLAPLVYLGLALDGPASANVTSDSHGFWLNALRYEPIVRLPEFVVGVVLGRLYLDDEVRRRCDAHAALGAAASVVAIAAVLACSSAIPYPLLHNGLLAPLYALLIVALAAGRGPLASVLASRPLVSLGEASYALYIIQIPLLVLWLKTAAFVAGERASLPAVSAASQIGFLFFAVAASLASHKYVEIPLRDRLRATWAAKRRSRSLRDQRSSPPSDSTRTSTSSVSPPPPT
jgi:peptidoglycan/LPS O-acetylase OafA/YrhL